MTDIENSFANRLGVALSLIQSNCFTKRNIDDIFEDIETLFESLVNEKTPSTNSSEG